MKAGIDSQALRPIESDYLVDTLAKLEFMCRPEEGNRKIPRDSFFTDHSFVSSRSFRNIPG